MVNDAHADADADPRDGRDETLNERMDRNWNEMLQEMRVTQTGTQILSGFLLTIVFQPKFSELTDFDRTLYLVLVVTAALTTALALAPVHLHRSLFRRHLKPALVQTAHLLLRGALVGLALVITGTVLLIFDVATGQRSAGMIAAGATVVILLGIGILPLLVERRSLRHASVGRRAR